MLQAECDPRSINHPVRPVLPSDATYSSATGRHPPSQSLADATILRCPIRQSSSLPSEVVASREKETSKWLFWGSDLTVHVKIPTKAQSITQQHICLTDLVHIMEQSHLRPSHPIASRGFETQRTIQPTRPHSRQPDAGDPTQPRVARETFLNIRPADKSGVVSTSTGTEDDHVLDPIGKDSLLYNDAAELDCDMLTSARFDWLHSKDAAASIRITIPALRGGVVGKHDSFKGLPGAKEVRHQSPTRGSAAKFPVVSVMVVASSRTLQSTGCLPKTPGAILAGESSEAACPFALQLGFNKQTTSTCQTMVNASKCELPALPPKQLDSLLSPLGAQDIQTFAFGGS
ncbi:hypothetical protein TgHK011_005856 [Trichoderma gracile]|nr:hypothetical protein TgHK011_005856 [Trichoderma gracile]